MTEPNNMTEPTGMTLRDYFAGQTLVGIMSNYQRLKEINHAYAGDDITIAGAVSSESYILADAMLEARKKGGGV